MNIVHKIINNEGAKVEATYADGNHDRVTIDRLLVQDGCVAMLLTVVGEGDQFVCACDFERPDGASLYTYHDSKQVKQFRDEQIIPQQGTRPDRRIVEISEIQNE